MTIQEQYDEHLDSIHESNPGTLFAGYAGSVALREIDPTAYRVGLADFEPTCEVCGETFCADETDNEAICKTCEAEEEE